MEISEVASTKTASGEAYTRSWWLILFSFLNSTSSKIIGQYPPLVSTCHFTFAYTFWKVWTDVRTFLFLFSVLTKVELAVPYVSSYSQSNTGWASSGTSTMNCIEVGLMYDETCQSLKSDLVVARWLFFPPHWASIWLIISPAWIKTPSPPFWFKSFWMKISLQVFTRLASYLYECINLWHLYRVWMPILFDWFLQQWVTTKKWRGKFK